MSSDWVRGDLLKNFLLWNCFSDFEIISQECLVTVFKNCSRRFDPSINMLMGATCTIRRTWRNSLNIFETTGQVSKYFFRSVPWVTVFKNRSRNFDASRNMAVVNGGYLHYTDMKKFLKNVILWNRWSYFEIISQKLSFDEPFQKLLVKFSIRQ